MSLRRGSSVPVSSSLSQSFLPTKISRNTGNSWLHPGHRIPDRSTVIIGEGMRPLSQGQDASNGSGIVGLVSLRLKRFCCITASWVSGTGLGSFSLSLFLRGMTTSHQPGTVRRNPRSPILCHSQWDQCEVLLFVFHYRCSLVSRLCNGPGSVSEEPSLLAWLRRHRWAPLSCL